MNLYEVLSEELGSFGSYFEPPERYCFFEYVVARNPSQARYLAWQTDESFEPTIADMPRMSCKLLKKNVEAEAGVTRFCPICETIGEDMHDECIEAESERAE